MYRVTPVIPQISAAMLAGMVLGTAWVNLSPESYYDMVEFRLIDPQLAFIRALPFDIKLLTFGRFLAHSATALLFFVIGKELWESALFQRGFLRRRDMGLWAIMCLGGFLGALVTWWLTQTKGQIEQITTYGWSVPFGGDVLLAYMMGKMIFGGKHRAIEPILAIAGVSSILGLLFMVALDPIGDISFFYLFMTGLCSFLTWRFFGRFAPLALSERDKENAKHLTPYLIGACFCFLFFWGSGLPLTLGLLPIIPAIAHGSHAFGLFSMPERFLHDPLNRMTHLMTPPLIITMALFGLTQGGIDFQAFNQVTLSLWLSMMVGKPLGMFIMALLAISFGLVVRPLDLSKRDLALIAVSSALAFVTPSLVADVTLLGGIAREGARLGFGLALLSGLAFAQMIYIMRGVGNLPQAK